MKRISFFIISLTFVFTAFWSPAENNDWQISKSSHFIVYHQGASSSYLSRLKVKAESYYQSITRQFGFQRFNFWSWDNRCNIFLYPDQASYLEATGIVSWSRAHVDVIKKCIITYIGKGDFLDTTLPHEMAHIIFRETVGFDKKLPIWFDEGVAILAEPDNRQRLKFAKGMVFKEKYVPLAKLSDIRNYNSVEPYAFYSQAASIVNFLLERYGRNNFVRFCRQLKDRDDWQDALRRVYGFRSLDEFEQGWLEYLK